jgi:hypothetical protein
MASFFAVIPLPTFLPPFICFLSEKAMTLKSETDMK